MKFFSIRAKLISLSTRILILSMTGFFISNSAIKFFSTRKTLRDTITRTESSLIRKGMTLVSNNSMALQGMVEDNAFRAVRTLVSSTVEKDEDVTYGIYMDNNRQPWVMVTPANPGGTVKDEFFLGDSASRWADTVQQAGYTYIKTAVDETFEFAAAVYSDSLRLGVIRYGITTAPLLKAVAELKKDALVDALFFLALMIVICIFFFLFGSQAMRTQAFAITEPLKMLTESAETIAKGNYTAPISISSDDEVGALAGSFETMRTTIEHYTTSLELMVVERTAQLEAAQKELVEKAHKAGMADIATGTLHNVGNILNSVKTSAAMIDEIIRESPLTSYKKANTLLRANLEKIDTFFTQNPKGPKLLQYYLKLEDAFTNENNEIVRHLRRLLKKIDTIAEVILAQQSYAGAGALSEEYDLAAVVDDAVSMQATSLDSQGIRVEKQFNNVPRVLLQQTKLVHVLINLINNAKDAMADVPVDQRRITIAIDSDEEAAFIRVRDSGVGIPPESLQKIFSHGYTTKKNGHGFGLHSSANYMTEMHGELRAESEGVGKGAVFVVKLKLRSNTSAGHPESEPDLQQKEPS
jgi:signal transduction histidine kinase